MADNKTTIHISKETAEHLGEAHRYLSDWVGPDKDVLILSNLDLLNEKPPAHSIKRGLLETFFLPGKSNREQQEDYIKKQLQYLEPKFPGFNLHKIFNNNSRRTKDNIKISILYTAAGRGLSYKLPKTNSHNRDQALIILPGDQKTFKEFFSHSAAIPNHKLTNINSMQKDVLFFITAHEAMHIREWDINPALRQERSKNQSVTVFHEIAADLFALREYHKALSKNAALSPSLPEEFLNMRAITSIWGVYRMVHMTNAYLLDKKVDDIKDISMAETEKIHKACIAFSHAVHKAIPKRAFDFLRDETVIKNPEKKYVALYKATERLEKTGMFDHDQYQHAYATQFMRALKKHAPSYTQ